MKWLLIFFFMMNKQIDQIKFSELCNFQPKQMEATKLADRHQYFLYGGSRGPGKSYWLRWDLVRELLKLSQAGIDNAVVGLFCEDYPSLTDRQISKIVAEFPQWLGTLKDSKKTGFGFHLRPEYGGGVIALRNLDDVSKYQSAEFAAIAVDELTKNDESVFDILRGSLRWKGVSKPKFMGATNPGGKGHLWVKRFWIDENLPDRLIKYKDEFCFLPALPTDNKHLSESYWEMLDSLPDRLRRAWRYGDWDAFEGQFFTFNRGTQVIHPFAIPVGWRLIGRLDPGYKNPCSFSLAAMDFEENYYRIATYYKSERSPKEHAEAIKEFLYSSSSILAKITRNRKPELIVADPSAWAKKDKWAIDSSERTFADIFSDYDLTLSKAVNDRIPGWWAMKDMMTRLNKDGTPKYMVFDIFNQPYLDELTAAVSDDKDPEDILGKGRDPSVPDHALDEERYGIMAIYAPRKKPSDDLPQWAKQMNKERQKKDYVTS
jgi:phage terminase large subunit